MSFIEVVEFLGKTKYVITSYLVPKDIDLGGRPFPARLPIIQNRPNVRGKPDIVFPRFDDGDRMHTLEDLIRLFGETMDKFDEVDEASVDVNEEMSSALIEAAFDHLIALDPRVTRLDSADDEPQPSSLDVPDGFHITRRVVRCTQCD